jgi:hypothetical protein
METKIEAISFTPIMLLCLLIKQVRNVSHKYDAYILSKVFDGVVTSYLAEQFYSRSVLGFMIVCGGLVTFPSGQASMKKVFDLYVFELSIAKMPLTLTPYKISFSAHVRLHGTIFDSWASFVLLFGPCSESHRGIFPYR